MLTHALTHADVCLCRAGACGGDGAGGADARAARLARTQVLSLLPALLVQKSKVQILMQPGAGRANSDLRLDRHAMRAYAKAAAKPAVRETPPAQLWASLKAAFAAIIISGTTPGPNMHAKQQRGGSPRKRPSATRGASSTAGSAGSTGSMRRAASTPGSPSRYAAN
jgi:hypothetical protein